MELLRSCCLFLYDLHMCWRTVSSWTMRGHCLFGVLTWLASGPFLPSVQYHWIGIGFDVCKRSQVMFWGWFGDCKPPMEGPVWRQSTYYARTRQWFKSYKHRIGTRSGTTSISGVRPFLILFRKTSALPDSVLRQPAELTGYRTGSYIHDDAGSRCH